MNREQRLREERLECAKVIVRKNVAKQVFDILVGTVMGHKQDHELVDYERIKLIAADAAAELTKTFSDTVWDVETWAQAVEMAAEQAEARGRSRRKEGGQGGAA